MPFELKNTVPWGRTLEEYRNIFNLTETDLDKQIISFGDGPASFNSEMKKLKKSVTSIDPIYQFGKSDLENHIKETKDVVMEQMRNNQNNFVWTSISNVDELERIRMNAMSVFIEDFEDGLSEKRYIHHELPNKLELGDNKFELGLSSHFLVLYSKLGLEFHIKSISEMLRLCKEIRIFPLLNLNAEKSEVLDDIIEYFENEYEVEIETVNYEFQKGGNEMMKIKRK